MIGAPSAKEPDIGSSGTVYAFERVSDGWSQQAILSPNESRQMDMFGNDLALSADGSTALIADVNGVDTDGNRIGALYVFTNGEGVWRQQARLTPDDAGVGNVFPSSVAVSSDGTTAISGAWGDSSPNGQNAGAAYVFIKTVDSWDQQTKLTPDDGDEGDWFGYAVSMSQDGRRAIIGARHDEDPNGQKAGTAYVFEPAETGWSQERKLAPGDGDANDGFGGAVAVSANGGRALIGAPFDNDPNGESAGSAYVFE